MRRVRVRMGSRWEKSILSVVGREMMWRKFGEDGAALCFRVLYKGEMDSSWLFSSGFIKNKVWRCAHLSPDL